MTKKQLVDRLAERGEISKSLAKIIVDLVFDGMTEALAKGGRVDLRGFGSFSVREYIGYTGMNPRWGNKVEVEPRRLAYFRAAKKMNKRLRSN